MWVSEFGSKLETNADKQWFTSLTSYLGVGASGINWTYWDLGPDSADTGGILNNDWTSVNQIKQTLLTPLMFPLGATTGAAPVTIGNTAATRSPAKTPTAGQSGPVSLQAYYKVGNPGSVTANEIMPQLELFNTGGASINLSDVTIRYWYTLDNQQAQSYWCDYAVVGCNNVNGQFASLSSTRSLVKANAYLQISFNSGAGSIAPGANSGQIQIRFNKNDWSNYNQADDYSYNGSLTAFTPSTKVTVYYKGALIWGSEPS